MRSKLAFMLTISMVVYLLFPLLFGNVKVPAQSKNLHEIFDYFHDLNVYWIQVTRINALPDFYSLPVLLSSITTLIHLILFVSGIRIQQKMSAEIREFSIHLDEINAALSKAYTPVPPFKYEFFPTSNICRDFLWWCPFNFQKAADIICGFYQVPRLKILLDRTTRNWRGKYVQGKNLCYLSENGRNATTLAHELFHHLAYHGRAPAPSSKEESAAEEFSKEIVRRAREKLLRRNEKSRESSHLTVAYRKEKKINGTHEARCPIFSQWSKRKDGCCKRYDLCSEAQHKVCKASGNALRPPSHPRRPRRRRGIESRPKRRQESRPGSYKSSWRLLGGHRHG